MSIITEIARFRFTLEFIFAVDDDTLGRRLSRDFPLSPTALLHSEEVRSRAALVHLAAILGRDHPQVTTNPDPRVLDTHVPKDRDDIDESRWNALEAPHLASTHDVRRIRRESLAQATNRHTVGIELLSPSFTFREWQNALSTITRLLGRLTPVQYPNLSGTGTHRDRSPKHTAWTNERCSFRLQFEPLEEDQHFHFRTLQHLIVIWGSLEDEIGKLQPLHHRYPPNGPLSLWNNVHEDTNLDEFAREVYTAASIPELQDIFEYDRAEGEFSKISFGCRNAFSPRVARCDAIEFREHAGTLDIKDMTFWIGLTSSLLGVCEELTEDGDLFALESPIDVMGIMQVVDASEQAEQYAWNRLLRMMDQSGDKGVRMTHMEGSTVLEGPGELLIELSD